MPRPRGEQPRPPEVESEVKQKPKRERQRRPSRLLRALQKWGAPLIISVGLHLGAGAATYSIDNRAKIADKLKPEEKEDEKKKELIKVGFHETKEGLQKELEEIDARGELDQIDLSTFYMRATYATKDPISKEKIETAENRMNNELVPHFLAIAEKNKDPLEVAYELMQPAKDTKEFYKIKNDKLPNLIASKGAETVGNCDAATQRFSSVFQRLQRKGYFSNVHVKEQIFHRHIQPIVEIDGALFNPSRAPGRMQMDKKDMEGTCLTNPTDRLRMYLGESVEAACTPMREKVVRTATKDISYKETDDVIPTRIKNNIVLRSIRSGPLEVERMQKEHQGSYEDRIKELADEEPEEVKKLAEKSPEAREVFVEDTLKKIESGEKNAEDLDTKDLKLIAKQANESGDATAATSIMETLIKKDPAKAKLLATETPLAAHAWILHRGRELEKTPTEKMNDEDSYTYRLYKDYQRQEANIAIYEIGKAVKKTKSTNTKKQEEGDKEIKEILDQIDAHGHLDILRGLALSAGGDDDIYKNILLYSYTKELANNFKNEKEKIELTKEDAKLLIIETAAQTGNLSFSEFLINDLKDTPLIKKLKNPDLVFVGFRENKITMEDILEVVDTLKQRKIKIKKVDLGSELSIENLDFLQGLAIEEEARLIVNSSFDESSDKKNLNISAIKNLPFSYVELTPGISGLDALNNKTITELKLHEIDPDFQLGQLKEVENLQYLVFENPEINTDFSTLFAGSKWSREQEFIKGVKLVITWTEIIKEGSVDTSKEIEVIFDHDEEGGFTIDPKTNKVVKYEESPAEKEQREKREVVEKDILPLIIENAVQTGDINFSYIELNKLRETPLTKRLKPKADTRGAIMPDMHDISREDVMRVIQDLKDKKIKIKKGINLGNTRIKNLDFLEGFHVDEYTHLNLEAVQQTPGEKMDISALKRLPFTFVNLPRHISDLSALDNGTTTNVQLNNIDANLDLRPLKENIRIDRIEFGTPAKGVDFSVLIDKTWKFSQKLNDRILEVSFTKMKEDVAYYHDYEREIEITFFHDDQQKYTVDPKTFKVVKYEGGESVKKESSENLREEQLKKLREETRKEHKMIVDNLLNKEISKEKMKAAIAEEAIVTQTLSNITTIREKGGTEFAKAFDITTEDLEDITRQLKKEGTVIKRIHFDGIKVKNLKFLDHLLIDPTCTLSVRYKGSLDISELAKTKYKFKSISLNGDIKSLSPLRETQMKELLITGAPKNLDLRPLKEHTHITSLSFLNPAEGVDFSTIVDSTWKFYEGVAASGAVHIFMSKMRKNAKSNLDEKQTVTISFLQYGQDRHTVDPKTFKVVEYVEKK